MGPMLCTYPDNSLKLWSQVALGRSTFLFCRVINDRGREVQECGNCAPARKAGLELLEVQQGMLELDAHSSFAEGRRSTLRDDNPGRHIQGRRLSCDPDVVQVAQHTEYIEQPKDY